MKLLKELNEFVDDRKKDDGRDDPTNDILKYVKQADRGWDEIHRKFAEKYEADDVFDAFKALQKSGKIVKSDDPYSNRSNYTIGAK